MKTVSLFLAFVLSFFTSLKAQDSFVGAWKSVEGEVTSILLITPEYFSITAYHDKNFIAAMGGNWKPASEGQADIKIEFNTEEKSQVGQQTTVPVKYVNGQIITSDGGGDVTWTRIDDGKGPLAGTWRITGRQGDDGKINAVPDSPRKTIKFLTGKRFQWVAIDTETGEFFGTGGGTYTFVNGTYTEKIEFFSRDNTRVGNSLSFKGTVDDKTWDHSGLSSKGVPIHEVWSR